MKMFPSIANGRHSLVVLGSNQPWHLESSFFPGMQGQIIQVFWGEGAFTIPRLTLP